MGIGPIQDDFPRAWPSIAFYSLLIVVVLAGGAWVYALPYITHTQIQDAAQNGDIEALSELVDFPQFRESIKETFKAKMTQEMSTQEEQNPFAGLAFMLADVVLDKLVDAAVSPGSIAGLMQGKQPMKDTGQQEAGDAEKAAIDPWAKANMSYAGLSKFVVRFMDNETGQEAIVLTLRRRGLSWQLTSLRMPLILNQKTNR